jgi:predicted transcriptional regulator
MNLQTRGMTTEEIAKQLGMTPDQVTQLILLANGDKTSRAGDYYMTSDILEKQVTEPYDRQRDRLAQEKQIALDRANEQLARLKEDFDIATERQKKKNEIDSHNAHFLASKY